MDDFWSKYLQWERETEQTYKEYDKLFKPKTSFTFDEILKWLYPERYKEYIKEQRKKYCK